MRQTGGRGGGARRNATQWRELVERFERGGQTRGRFCAVHGLALSTFDLWRRKLRGTGSEKGGEAGALFVELSNLPRAESVAASWEVELELGGGVVLRMRRTRRC